MRVQTHWTDADPAGQVYFANFFRFADYAEAELFRVNGTERMKLLEQFGMWMPRVECFAKFSKPIRAEQAVFVQMRTQFKGEKTVRMNFEILSVEDRNLLAAGYVTAVCIDRVTSKSCPMPPEIRAVFKTAEGDLVE